MTERKVIIKGGRKTLFINDEPSACPFRAGQLIQTSLGQTTFINQCCDSSCPHFNLSHYRMDQQKPKLVLTCGAGTAFNVTINEEGNDLGNLSIHR
jgi:hypothetical protein